MAADARTIAGTTYTAVATGPDERVINSPDGTYLGVAAKDNGMWWTMDSREHRTLALAADHLARRAARAASRQAHHPACVKYGDDSGCDTCNR